MDESTRDWSPNKDRGRRRGGSEGDEDKDFLHALTHSPHSRIMQTLSSPHRQAQRSASPKACSPSLGSANVANPLMLREVAQPEQQHQQQQQQQQRHLSHTLRYIVVPFERRQSNLILSGLQPEPPSRNFYLVA